jgi:hypothetical protein
MQDKPYRVVVWGPGTLGGVLLREILPKSELDLVGVLAYSKEKDGVDVGTYLGLPPVGVTMTTDKERIFGLGADVALLAPHIMAQVDLHADLTDDICRLLESGTNVISASGYFYPPHHGPELVERLEAACRAGGTVLHSTGINPGLLNERWTTTLTSVFTRIDRIVVQEIFDCSALPSADMVQAIGFGRDPSESHAVIELGERYYGESLANTCRILGHQMVRLDMERDFILADADYQIGALTVAKGTIGGLIHRFTALRMLDGPGRARPGPDPRTGRHPVARAVGPAERRDPARPHPRQVPALLGRTNPRPVALHRRRHPQQRAEGRDPLDAVTRPRHAIFLAAVATAVAVSRRRFARRQRRLAFTPSSITRDAGISMRQAKLQADLRVRSALLDPFEPKTERSSSCPEP